MEIYLYAITVANIVGGVWLVAHLRRIEHSRFESFCYALATAVALLSTALHAEGSGSDIIAIVINLVASLAILLRFATANDYRTQRQKIRDGDGPCFSIGHRRISHRTPR